MVYIDYFPANKTYIKYEPYIIDEYPHTCIVDSIVGVRRVHPCRGITFNDNYNIILCIQRD